MSGAAARRGATPTLPLLDRLAAEADGQAVPGGAPRGLEALREGVRRDLEALLNARRRRWPLPEGLEELPLSLLAYGIPDATAGCFADPVRRAGLAEEVERTIRLFETRLVRAEVAETTAGDLDRALRLRIDAEIRADPEPEPIALETVIEAITHAARVRDAAGGAGGGAR